MSRRTVTWNREKYLALVKAYETNIRRPSFSLVFEDGETLDLHTGYAKYLIEYLSADFAQPDQPRRPYNEGEEGQ